MYFQFIQIDFRHYSESKPRRQSSFNGGTKYNGNGTLPKSINVSCNTPKILAKTYNETDTATIKRNSHLNNAKMRLKDDEEKYQQLHVHYFWEMISNKQKIYFMI